MTKRKQKNIQQSIYNEKRKNKSKIEIEFKKVYGTYPNKKQLQTFKNWKNNKHFRTLL